MDHRSLYKVGSEQILDSTVKNKRKSKINADRSKKRNNLYLIGRNMQDDHSTTLDRENQEPAEKSEGRIAQKKLSKEQAYLAKFLAWKAKKEACLKEAKKNKLKPFYSAVSSSFAPKDFKFKAPVGLTYPTSNKNVVSDKNKNIERTAAVSNKQQKTEAEVKAFRKPFTPVKSTKVVAPKVKPVQVINAIAPCPPTHFNSKNEKRNVVRNVDPHKKKALLRPPQIIIPKVSRKIRTPSKIVVATKKDLEIASNDFSNCLTSTGRKSTHNPNTLPSLKEDFGDVTSPIDVNDSAEIANNDIGVKSPDKCGDKLKSARKSLIAVTKEATKSSNTVALKEAKLVSTQEHPEIVQCRVISSKQPNHSEENVDLNSTPQNHHETSQANYMSPFVTTSRGKISAKKEREKRESVYTLEMSSPDVCNIQVRRARESVKYFRQVLNDEVDRLRKRCEFWEQYKLQNGDKIEENGTDMIDVTIGQTKLLTSKKFEQFRGLIDRCEQNSLNGESGSGPAQAILPEDLEGFWSMVQLQVENVDKRFENLDLWKAHDWHDPDDDKPKPKKNLLSKVTKKKVGKPRVIKPNEQLKNLLKKAQTAYKKSKTDNLAQDCDIIYVPSKRSSTGKRRSTSNTPVRRSSRQLEARSNSDRKRSLNNRRKSSIIAKNSPKSTPRRSIVKVRRSLLINTLNKAHEDKRLSKSPRIAPRKSILKTPGTIKHQKKVFFNEELDYNSPESFGNGNCMSGIDILSDEDNELQRSLHLRSRRVILRPDFDIEIP